MNFIKLTLSHNEKSMYINFELVESFCNINDKGSRLYFSYGEHGQMHVKETPEEIQKKLLDNLQLSAIIKEGCKI